MRSKKETLRQWMLINGEELKDPASSILSHQDNERRSCSLEERKSSEIVEKTEISSPEERRLIPITQSETDRARELAIDAAQTTMREEPMDSPR